MAGLGFPEAAIVAVLLAIQLAPWALAIVALVMASRLRKQVAALEDRVARLESSPPPPAA